ncbi:hypothetical protein ACN38_g8892 [Penicillium nordicum]|uniref:Uncharacterized protein n=1 Tax=Penicillium nordicum TaxID=229535 RepID=A0A0M8NWI2_9EURO|nr:hypothetical protein ACN38_g8892 [Penicillium nordicum]
MLLKPVLSLFESCSYEFKFFMAFLAPIFQPKCYLLTMVSLAIYISTIIIVSTIINASFFAIFYAPLTMPTHLSIDGAIHLPIDDATHLPVDDTTYLPIDDEWPYAPPTGQRASIRDS